MTIVRLIGAAPVVVGGTNGPLAGFNLDDASFTVTEVAGQVKVVSTGPASAFMATVLDDTTAVAAQATLGAQPGSVAIINDGNSSTADTIDFSAGPHHKSTMTGACTYTFTAPTNPGVIVTLRLIQDGTGGRVATFPETVVGSPIYNKTATTGDSTLAFLYDGTSYVFLGSSHASTDTKTLVRVGMANDQETAAGVPELVEFDTEEVDSQSEFNAGTFTYTATSPRKLRVRATVRTAPGGSGEGYLLRIRKNTTARAETSNYSASANPETFSVEDTFSVNTGDTIDVQVSQGNGTRSLNGGVANTYLVIEELAR
jgi:hypothetical protein